MKGSAEMTNQQFLIYLMLIKELILNNDNKKCIQILDKLIKSLK